MSRQSGSEQARPRRGNALVAAAEVEIAEQIERIEEYQEDWKHILLDDRKIGGEEQETFSSIVDNTKKFMMENLKSYGWKIIKVKPLQYEYSALSVPWLDLNSLVDLDKVPQKTVRAMMLQDRQRFIAERAYENGLQCFLFLLKEWVRCGRDSIVRLDECSCRDIARTTVSPNATTVIQQLNAGRLRFLANRAWQPYDRRRPDGPIPTDTERLMDPSKNLRDFYRITECLFTRNTIGEWLEYAPGGGSDKIRKHVVCYVRLGLARVEFQEKGVWAIGTGPVGWTLRCNVLCPVVAHFMKFVNTGKQPAFDDHQSGRH